MGEPVPARFLLLGSHSEGEPLSWGLLGSRVSCLKSSQFSGPFKVSTPTRGPQDYKTLQTLSCPGSYLRHSDARTHAHTHTCTHAHMQNSLFCVLTRQQDNYAIYAQLLLQSPINLLFSTILLLIRIPRQLREGNVREGITFQTWHTPLNIRTEIKASPLPTTAHPQQSLQSAPIV